MCFIANLPEQKKMRWGRGTAQPALLLSMCTCELMKKIFQAMYMEISGLSAAKERRNPSEAEEVLT